MSLADIHNENLIEPDMDALRARWEREAAAMAHFSTVMRMVCYVCGTTTGYKDGKGVSGVSHGLCPTCLEVKLREIVEEM